ncbi:MAG: Mfa1 family fimbria major subunit [Muribaculaceae bacterium]|nr:Mfa1 family fimbria major subunit [Muribaculaceae bacterium]
MTTRILKLSALPLALGLLLSGCSADNSMSEPEKPVDRDTDFYMNVRIATPAEDATRADDVNDNTSTSDYVDGTAAEQAIHKILFVFYNSNHEYVGNATYTPTAGTSVPTGNGDGNTIETVLNLTVPVTVAAGSTKPAYVMAYVNPTNRAESDLFNDYYSALGAFRTLDEVREIASGSNAHKGFAMNNSVHYEAENKDELPTIAAPINADTQLFPTAAAAEKAGPESQVTIYVERIVAKVTLKQDEEWVNNIQNNTFDDEAGKTYTLNFNVLGWGLSNLERHTFLVKNFRTVEDGNPRSFEDLMSFTNYTYDVLNKRLTDSGLTKPHWNFPGNTSSSDESNWGISGHRTFWALSPTYYQDNVKIPIYADDIYYADNAGEAPRVHQNNSSLIYRSFNDIYNVNTQAIGPHGKKPGESQYTLEHTMQASLVTNYQKRAVTCAVVVGKYDLYENGEKLNYDNFYIRKKMTEHGHVDVIYPSDKDMMEAYLRANSTICVKVIENGVEKYVPVSADNADLEDFEIAHPRADITGESSVASRYVTLRLKNPGSNKYYYQDATGVYVAITSANLINANQYLYTNMIGMLGGIEIYKNGYAYFEVPIKHLWARDKVGIGDKDFNAQLGQYGIVRNHCYNINVQGISGLGIGVDDPDAPVVPNVDNDDYVVKTEIRVQRWRVVPTQNVTLKQ